MKNSEIKIKVERDIIKYNKKKKKKEQRHREE